MDVVEKSPISYYNLVSHDNTSLYLNLLSNLNYNSIKHAVHKLYSTTTRIIERVENFLNAYASQIVQAFIVKGHPAHKIQ
jgi:hypothetical protein